MTNQQINATIAEVCGWTDIHESGPWHNHKLWGYPPELHGQSGIAYKYVPDYARDLNAMHEAEDFLRGNEFQRYAEMLDSIIGSLNGIRAIARERAEAFLRVIGKWEEAQS